MNETNIHTKTIITKAWSASEGCWRYSFVFAFETRSEYLEFRRCWKDSYAALSILIRGLKSSIKATMRSQDYAGKQQNEAHARAIEATVQLAMLRVAKSEANRHYLETKRLAK